MKSTSKPVPQLGKEPRELRYRRQLFPGGEVRVFQTAGGGFVPLPILLRKMLRHLSAAQLRVLIYLYLRTGRYGLCYPSTDEMAHEIGISRKNLIPHLHRLEELGLISIRQSGGRNYYLVHDPVVALRIVIGRGEVGEGELMRINELCEDLRLEPFETEAKATKKGGDRQGVQRRP